MLSLQECRKILGNSQKDYSDEDLTIILDFLSKIAKIENQLIFNYYETSNNLHKN
jgi:hypothetical protein